MRILIKCPSRVQYQATGRRCLGEAKLLFVDTSGTFAVSGACRIAFLTMEAEIKKARRVIRTEDSSEKLTHCLRVFVSSLGNFANYN